MNKLLIAALAGSAFAVAAPAAAQYQPYQQYPAYPGYQNPSAQAAITVAARIAALETRIDAGLRNRTISTAEARTLRRELRELRRLDHRYSRNGYRANEQRDMHQRLATLRQRVRTADRGSYDRYEQYGMWRDFDSPYAWGQYQQPYYGQPYYGQQGYPGYYGRGGPYEEVSQVCADRGLIGNILGNMLGATNCLRVGQRVSGNALSGLPTQYRNDFRDGGGYVYRWLDGNVLQIDARTGVVARIYDVD